MVASLRPTTILALLPPSPVFAASLQPAPAAKCAAWLPAADSLSATASRLSAASPVGRHPRKLASCRRAVAVPAAAIRRPSRPVRFAAGNAQLSHAKVGEALGGFPCFAAVRLAPTPRFPACCFVPRLCRVTQGRKVRKAKTTSFVRRLRLSLSRNRAPSVASVGCPRFLNGSATAYPIPVRDRLLKCAPGCGRILPRRCRKTPRRCRRG